MTPIHSRPQTFHDHIKELRNRLAITCIVLMGGAGLGYVLHKPLVAYLQKPFPQSLYFTSPAGGFNFVMKICFMAGLGVALPVLVYNIVSYIRPAFGNLITPKLVRGVTLMSVILAFVGAAFGFFSVVPMSLHFFQSFQTDTIKPLISASDYLGFVTNCIITFMLIFQLPLIVLFIDRIKPLTPSKLLKYEKYVIPGSFLLAVILPFSYDPLTQFLLAVPIILLYNLSIICVMIAHHSRKSNKRAQSAAQAYTRALQPDRPTNKRQQTIPQAAGLRAAAAQARAPHTAKLQYAAKTSTSPAKAKSSAPYDIVRPVRSSLRRPIEIQRFTAPPRRTNFLDLSQSMPSLEQSI